MVREYDHTRQLSACVLLSVDGISINDENILDDCCSAARTVCETLVDSGASVSFFTNARLKRSYDDEVWRCEASAGRTSGLLEGLGHLLCFSRSPLSKLLEYAHRESEFDSAFIVILPAAENGGGEAIGRLRAATGREVLLVDMRGIKDVTA